MDVLKTVLVMSLGLGATWAAWQIAPAETSGMLTGVAYAQDAPAPTLDEPSEADIEEQLARIEEALARQGEVKEFEPSEPLPADTAIEMSSEL